MPVVSFARPAYAASMAFASKTLLQDCNSQDALAGQTATDALKAVIGDSSIQCQVRAIDLYGRNVSACTLPGTGDISDWLVKNGHAVAYR